MCPVVHCAAVQVLGYGEAMWAELSAGVGPGLTLKAEEVVPEEVSSRSHHPSL